MNVRMFLLIVVSCFIWPVSLNGQEPENTGQRNEADSSASFLKERTDDFRTMVLRVADWISNQHLKRTSGRNLKFPVGRYWVDQYSRLIDSRDCDIGFWGVDSSPPIHVPMSDRR